MIKVLSRSLILWEIEDKFDLYDHNYCHKYFKNIDLVVEIVMATLF